VSYTVIDWLIHARVSLLDIYLAGGTRLRCYLFIDFGYNFITTNIGNPTLTQTNTTHSKSVATWTSCETKSTKQNWTYYHSSACSSI